MPKFKIEEIKSWEQYLEAHSTDIPAGKENEYVAKALIAFKNKNADPQIPYSQKKAEKDASQMMKNPLFIQEMQNNKPEILAMMQQGQYDKVVDKTVPPIPFKKETIDKAYQSLLDVQQKMHNGDYKLERNPHWNEVQRKVDDSIEAHKDPKQSEFDQMFNLTDVFTSVRKMMAGGPMKGPERNNMLNFALDIMTELGGGKENVEKRMDALINDTYGELERTTAELKKELGIDEPQKNGPQMHM